MSKEPEGLRVFCGKSGVDKDGWTYHDVERVSLPDDAAFLMGSARMASLQPLHRAQTLLLELVYQVRRRLKEVPMQAKKQVGGSTQEAQSTSNLSFAGNGKVSVPVASIVQSQRVQEQVKAVREIAASVRPEWFKPILQAHAGILMIWMPNTADFRAYDIAGSTIRTNCLDMAWLKRMPPDERHQYTCHTWHLYKFIMGTPVFLMQPRPITNRNAAGVLVREYNGQDFPVLALSEGPWDVIVERCEAYMRMAEGSASRVDV